MKTNKLCCRIFPIVILVISFAIGTLIWFFEEGNYTFTFLTNKNEIFSFFGTVLFISIIPIGIFYFMNDKENSQSKARAISLLGFLPAVGWLLYTLF